MTRIDDPEVRARLGSLVQKRRFQIGLTQEEVRAAGGPSTATMRLIEGGLQDSYRPGVLADLERALQWEHGSVDLVIAGGDPIPLRQDEMADATPQQMAAAINGLSDEELKELGIEPHEIAVVRAVAEKIVRQGGSGEKGPFSASG